MKIDIIICTYNRPLKVLELIDQLIPYSHGYNSIIVVDSSDNTNSKLINSEQLIYLQSSHKNQPFQRYLGYVNSTADILIFLDDDMEIANPKFLEIIENMFQDPNISGMAINFKDKHKETALADIPKTALFTKGAILKKIAGWLSGYPILPDGKFGFCGLRGNQPQNGGNTEWLSGGAFAARKSGIFQNFNFQLIDLFEQKLGMGEDALIGYGISKQGKLYYNPELLFYHNDQKDSSYSVDHFKYSQRVVFSRLFLSLEKARLDCTNLIWPRLYYHWHTLWRLCGLSINYFMEPSLKRKRILTGGLKGWMLAIGFSFNKLPSRKNYWQYEIENI